MTRKECGTFFRYNRENDTVSSGVPRTTEFLRQRISIELQRGNAVSVLLTRGNNSFNHILLLHVYRTEHQRTVPSILGTSIILFSLPKMPRESFLDRSFCLTEVSILIFQQYI